MISHSHLLVSVGRYITVGSMRRWALCFCVFVYQGAELWGFKASNKITSNISIIENWRVWGPVPEEFVHDLENSLLNIKLPRSDQDQSKNSDKNDPFEKVNPQSASMAPVLDFVTVVNRLQIDRPTGAIYFAETELISQSAMGLYLCFGHDDGLQIWVNGREVYNHSGKQKFISVSNIVKVPARIGRNFIVLRSHNIEEGKQRVVFAASTDLTNAAFFLATESGRFLARNVVDDLSQIRTIWSSLPDAPTDKIQVQRNGILIKQDLGHPAQSTASSVEDGIYRARIDLGGKLFTEDFLVGDPFTYPQGIATKLRQNWSDDLAPDAEALRRRFDALYRLGNFADSDPDWLRKVVFTTDQAQKLLDDPAIYRSLFGMRLRGFKSKIDDQTQFYRIYIPEELGKRAAALPLAIIIPTTTSADRPFIESAFIARQLEADRWAALADKAGTALLWLGYRCQPYGNPAEFSHFEEVLADVEGSYRLDHRRISLLATCRAGMTGSMMAIHWPDRFAAIALVDPICTRASNGPADEKGYRHFDAYSRWIEELNPLGHIAELKSTPVLILQDGAEAGHGSMVDATELMQCAERNGVSMVLQQLPPSVLHLDSWKRAMDWCVSKTRKNAVIKNVDSEVHTQRFPTVNCALDSPFVVVIPTQHSSLLEVKRDELLLKTFTEMWLIEQYGSCRKVYDREVNSELEAKYNLVLLGSPTTNIIWKNKDADLPYKPSPTGFTVDGNKSVTLSQYSFICTCTNPSALNRRLVLMGTVGSPPTFDLKFLLGRDGWFTYAVWDVNHVPIAMERVNFTP